MQHGGTPEPSAARLGEPLLSGAGESGLYAAVDAHAASGCASGGVGN